MIRMDPPSELVYAERIAQIIELLQGKWTVHFAPASARFSHRMGRISGASFRT
jgi:hypothetical protein